MVLAALRRFHLSIRQFAEKLLQALVALVEDLHQGGIELSFALPP